ncbi:MAG: hypothetical protein Kow0077_00180 [Anaerolineae bacterium]
MARRDNDLWLAVVVLLLAAVLRLSALGTLPPGFSDPELQSLTITEVISAGEIRVFETTGAGNQQETLFHILQATLTSLTGKGQITLRLLSVWAGLLALAGLYALARRWYSSRVALLATALMAVGFWPVLLSRLTIREALLPLVTVGVLLIFSHSFYIRQRIVPDPPNLVSYTLLGTLLAASLYVHWFGLLLAVFVTLSVLYLLATRQPISRRATGVSLFAVAVSAIIVIPYVATTVRQFSTSGVSILLADLAPDSLPEALISGLAAIFPRGDLSAVVNVPGRPLLDPVTALMFAIGLVQGFRYWRRPTRFLPALATIIALIPALFSSVPGAFPPFAGALPLIYLIAARTTDEAVHSLAKRRPQWQRFAPLAMALLVVVNLGWTGIDLFVTWPRQEAVQTAYHADQSRLARYLDRSVHRLPTVVCSPRLVDTAERPGDPRLLRLMMHRPMARIRYVDCANGLILAEGGAEQQIAFTDTSIKQRIYPDLATWLETADAVEVAGLPAGSVLQYDIATRLEDRVGSFLTTAPTGWAPESPDGAGPAPLPVRFGGNITFLGYQPVSEPVYQPGDVVPVITYWRTDGDVPPDLRIFTHVLSDPAAIVTQSSVINVWPTTLQNRDIFIQVSYVTLPESVPAGQYDLSIGAYRATSGLRLPVFDGQRVRGDRLFLYQISVAAPEG